MPMTMATLQRFQMVFGKSVILVWAEEGPYYYGKLPKVSSVTPNLGGYEPSDAGKGPDKKLNASKQRLQKAIRSGDVVVGKLI